jgi:hypothetical protein
MRYAAARYLCPAQAAFPSPYYVLDLPTSALPSLLYTHPQVINLGKSGLPAPLVALARAPLVERMIAEIFQIFIMKPKDVGSVDLVPQQEQLSITY